MRPFLLFLLVCFSFSLFAQDEPTRLRWGKIDQEDLDMTSYDFDSEAEAVVLFDYGILRVEEVGTNYKCRFNRIKRVKILKESGLSRGNISIPFYHYNQGELLSDVGAQVFLPNGEKQTLSKKEIFEEKRNEYWSAKNFSLPNLQVGSVFEYHYEIVSSDLTHLRPWTFQEDIPIRHSELTISIPKYFEYIFLLSGQELADAARVGSQEASNSPLKIVSPINPFILEHIPAIKEESYITCMDDYTLGIRFQLSTIHYPDGRIDPVLSTWELLAKEIEEHRYIGQQYQKEKNYKKMLEKAQAPLDAASTQEEKLSAACLFLQQNLTSNGFHSFSAKESLDQLFEEQKVSSGEINLMLMALLKASGIPVFPILVSTRGHGKMIPSYPILDQFNHLMVCAVIDGNARILDLGDPYRPPSTPRISALNKIGWLVEGEKSRWIKVEAPSSRQVMLADMELDETGVMTGTFKGRYSGYDAVSERNDAIEHTDGKHWKERLQKQFSEAAIEEFNTEYQEEIDQDFRNDFKATIPGAVQSSAELLYVSPILHSNFRRNPLKLQERNYPVDIPYPSQEQYIFKLKMPEGYTLETLPEDLNLQLPDQAAAFQYKATQNQDHIQVMFNVHLKRLEYPSEEYKSLKDFFDQVLAKMEDLIVLKKMDE